MAEPQESNPGQQHPIGMHHSGRPEFGHEIEADAESVKHDFILTDEERKAHEVALDRRRHLLARRINSGELE